MHYTFYDSKTPISELDLKVLEDEWTKFQKEGALREKKTESTLYRFPWDPFFEVDIRTPTPVPGEFQVVARDPERGTLVGVVTGKIKNPSRSEIEKVSVAPEYREQKQCVPLMKYTLDKLFPDRKTSSEPTTRQSTIKSFSSVGEGIPACLCYLRAAQELGLELLDDYSDAVTRQRCLENPFGQFHYVLSSKGKRGKKRKGP